MLLLAEHMNLGIVSMLIRISVTAAAVRTETHTCPGTFAMIGIHAHQEACSCSIDDHVRWRVEGVRHGWMQVWMRGKQAAC